MGAVLLGILLSRGHWAPMVALCTLPKAVLGSGGLPAGTVQRHDHTPSNRAPRPRRKLAAGGPRWGNCWGPRTHSRQGPMGPVARPEKERGPLGLGGKGGAHPLRCRRSAPEHPPRRRSSLRASSASSRSPPADSRPGPSSPRASMGPAARRRRNPAPNFFGVQRGHGLSGPRAGVRSTTSAAGRCARGPPWGQEPRPKRRAERPGGGAAARGGAGGSLRLAPGVRPLCTPLRGDLWCPDATPSAGRRARTGRGGAGLGLPAGTSPGSAASCPCAAGAG